MAEGSPRIVDVTGTVERPPSRLSRYLRGQFELLHVRLLFAQFIIGLIPVGLMGNVRAMVYRWAGFKHIADKVYIFGPLDLRGSSSIYTNLEVGACSEINSPCFLDIHAPVSIGSCVSIGHHVVIVTSNHFVGSRNRRCGGRDSRSVTISDGAWIGCSVTVMPGVVIGRGAVVTAGSVVTKSVPPDSKVSGNPARVIGWLDGGIRSALD